MRKKTHWKHRKTKSIKTLHMTVSITYTNFYCTLQYFLTLIRIFDNQSCTYTHAYITLHARSYI